MEEIGGKRVKNPVLHGLKKRFLYLIACSTSQNQGMLWVGKDLKSQCSKGQGNAGSVQGLLQGCLHPFPSGNLQERKISAAPQGLGPQGHTGWVSFYQENLKAPKAQESAWSSWFCLILFPRNATRTIPRQNLIQTFSLGAFSTQIQMCQNLSLGSASAQGHTQDLRLLQTFQSHRNAPKKKLLLPEMATFVLHCYDLPVEYLQLPSSRAHTVFLKCSGAQGLIPAVPAGSA